MDNYIESVSIFSPTIWAAKTVIVQEPQMLVNHLMQKLIRLFQIYTLILEVLSDMQTNNYIALNFIEMIGV